jgi:hypothetical protein
VRDRLFVAAAVGVAAILAAWPALSRAAGWNRPEPPALARAEGRGECVEPPAVMRASHMRLLADWRDRAVRQGDRTYRARDGREIDISLSGTCLRCHADKAAFCDRCHDYANVSPGCWDCHLQRPGGSAGGRIPTTPRLR